VKITLAPSAVSETGEPRLQYLTSFLINDTIAVDAGSLGLLGTPQEQARIKHVLITHTHIDHVGSLPIFVENIYQDGPSEPVTIYGSAPVLDSLQKDIFNDRIWPDFINLSKVNSPFLKLETIEAGKTIRLNGLSITPVPVNHVVPTLGLVIEEKNAAIVIVSDTGPTDAIWERASATPNLKAIFLEATFPNELGWLAEVSKHLTPSLFAGEIQKLKKQATIIAVHIKARHREQVIKELKALAMPNLEIGQFGRAYTF
jgi:cAMP phosphodiesterase